MTILGCAGSEEESGANFTPPTIGNFMQRNSLDQKRLRESRAASTVISEARTFHERQARKYGVDTNRGIAHFKASKMYAREGKLQEMLNAMQGQQGGEDTTELDELPPKAVMKAHKSAAKFHKQQADKAGLDSDLGHAHVAAMEDHLDKFKAAKNKHQQSQSMPGSKSQKQGKMPNAGGGMESEEGGPGSGPRKGPDTGGTHDKNKTQTQYAEKKLDLKNPVDRRLAQAFFKKNTKKEAAGGHGSKNSPMPVPKKSDMKNGDIKQNKPPVNIDPSDANKDQQGGTRLVSQKSETMGAHAGMIKASKEDEGGPGSGRHAGGATTEKTMKHLGYKRSSDGKWRNKQGHAVSHEKAVAASRKYAGDIKSINDAFESERRPSLESRLRAFESDANCVVSAKPSPVRDQMEDDLVFKGKRQKMHSGTAAAESTRRRSLRRSNW